MSLAFGVIMAIIGVSVAGMSLNRHLPTTVVGIGLAILGLILTIAMRTRFFGPERRIVVSDESLKWSQLGMDVVLDMVDIQELVYHKGSGEANSEMIYAMLCDNRYVRLRNDFFDETEIRNLLDFLEAHSLVNVRHIAGHQELKGLHQEVSKRIHLSSR